MIGKNEIVKQAPSVFQKVGEADAYFKKIGTSKAALLNSLLVNDFLSVKLFEYALGGNKGYGMKCLSRFDLKTTEQWLCEYLKFEVKSIKELFD